MTVTQQQQQQQLEALRAEIEALGGEVAALRRDRDRANEEARQVTRPIGMGGDPAAAAHEAAAHRAWKARMGYGPAPLPQLSVEQQAEQYQRQVAAALKAERATKERIEAQARENAARRAKANTPDLDEYQRQAAGVQHLRQVEQERPDR